MPYVYIPVPHDACIYYGSQMSTNKEGKINLKINSLSLLEKININIFKVYIKFI